MTVRAARPLAGRYSSVLYVCYSHSISVTCQLYMSVILKTGIRESNLLPGRRLRVALQYECPRPVAKALAL